MSGIIEFRSGLPLSIYQFTDSTLSGSDPSGTSLPDLIGRFRRVDPRNYQTMPLAGSAFIQSGHFFFNPSAFSVIAPTDFSQARNGNSPIRAFDGPGYNMTSVSLAKTFTLSGDHRIVVRADARNVFNHVNFDSPNTQADSVLFGQVTGAAPGRTIQFSARYVF